MPDRINAGQALVVVGAVVLFISLFLDWYEAPFEESLSAWTTFEVLDIVLAGLAFVAIAGVFPVPRDEEPATLFAASLVPWLGLAALVLVVVSLINDPPAARGLELDVGAWIGLAGAAVLAIGGVLSLARISVVVGTRPEDREAASEPVEQQDTQDMEPLPEEPLPEERPATEPMPGEPPPTEPTQP